MNGAAIAGVASSGAMLPRIIDVAAASIFAATGDRGRSLTTAPSISDALTPLAGDGRCRDVVSVIATSPGSHTEKGAVNGDSASRMSHTAQLFDSAVAVERFGEDAARRACGIGA